MNGRPYFYSLTTTPEGDRGALLGLWSESSGLSGPELLHLVDPTDANRPDRTDLFLDSLPSVVELDRVPCYHLSPGSPPRRSVDVGTVYRSSETGAVLLCESGGSWFVEDPTPYTLRPRCLLPVPGVPSIGTGSAVRLPAALWSGLSGGGGFATL